MLTSMGMKKYIPNEIEPKWQKKWEEEGIYASGLDKENKYYCLAEFAYPSGDLHMGHWFTFGGADIFARMKRMQGLNVFFPNGFDAFGLPAENAAIKKGIHPKTWTLSNIEAMRQQFSSIGASFSFDHQVITCLPEYYKWNQWIFLKMLEKGIAFRDKKLANWCPSCQTVLADEQVVEGKCERCDSEVTPKEIPQWFLKITEYADRLLWDKDSTLDWPKAVKDGQNNWIGKSEGVTFRYKVKDLGLHFEMFDSVPQTFMAQTYTVIAPEHPKVYELVKGTEYEKDVMEFVEKIRKKKVANKFNADKEMEGIFTGRYIEYTPTGKLISIWVASFVIYEYGTGVVNASAHDERDFAFAKKYDLPLHPVMFPKDPIEAEKVRNLEYCYHHAEDGILEEPNEFKNRKWGEVREDIIKYIEKKGYGKRKVQYHLHDWSVSRQRYWGTPVPIIHCDKCGLVPVPEKDLPVSLPDKVDFTPKGKAPLETAEDWINTKCSKCGGKAKRDAETLDGFFDNSWYFLRYLDPQNENKIFDGEIAKKWMPVDIYFGGAEHTLGHTLYSRFFIKFLFDIGVLTFEEYAKRRINHGIVLGPDGEKMSKSRGNVVNPDIEVKKYGADAVRIHVAFFMPYQGTGPWVSERIGGAYRFLQRVWVLTSKVGSDSFEVDDLRIMHKTIKKVTEDIENIKFNTAIASLMEWLNYLSKKEKGISKKEYETFLLLLAPFAPHMTEELWQELNKKLDVRGEKIDKEVGSSSLEDPSSNFKSQYPASSIQHLISNWSIHQQSWPKSDNKYLETEETTIVIQINGKVRDTLLIQKDIISSKEVVEKMALGSKKVKKFLAGQAVKKTIYVPGKIFSIVV
ncbi:TPA: leucine--tRNA ligase [Candidatus Daviesbacteria bacterium]|nr:leucine--tRNA ligase [Candidatus Daviesbacteria bacterium]